MDPPGRPAAIRRVLQAFALCLLLAGGLLAGHRLATSAPGGRPEVRIAIIGDQSLTMASRAVLQLIADEAADAVLHNGDFDYQDDPAAWDAQIDAFLGPDFPYFASVGNHDEARFYGPGGYQEVLEARMNRLGIPWEGDLGVQSSHEWQGIFFVLTAPAVFGAGDGLHDVYIRDRLAASSAIWRLSGWHENMRRMNVGAKGDTTGWGVYEESRRGGAIITTGHSHTYSRSHLLSSMELQEVADTSNDFVVSQDDPATSEDEGRSFVVVSGIAGRSIRAQQRDDPWWASIYTSDQNAQPGALFGVFYEGGVANRARFYFKNVAGEIIDEFSVTSAVGVPIQPTLLSENLAVAEGDSGSRDAEVHVVLLAPGGAEVSVDYATRDGAALAGSDYDAVSGGLVFAPGVTEQIIRVPIRGDSVEEGDESFSIELSNPVNAVLPYASSSVTILDDDRPLLVTLDVSASAGGSVQLEPPGGSYAPGTLVTLTALPAEGYVFDGWSGDLLGAANPQNLVLNGDRAVGASFVVAAPVLREERSGGSSESSRVATAQTLTAADGQLYLAAVAAKPHTEVVAVSGLGLAWSPVLEQCAGRGQTGVSVWQARGTPTGDDVVTATLSSAPRNAVISVSRYEGAGSASPGNAASANSTGQPGVCSGGVDTASYGFDLDLGAAGSSVFLAVAMRQWNHLPGAGFVEHANLHRGSPAGNEVGLSIAQGEAGPPPRASVAGDFDAAVDWAAVAVELRTLRGFDLTLYTTTGGSVTVDPPEGPYPAGSIVTLTATPDPGFVLVRWMWLLSSEDGNPAQLTMDANRLVVALFAPEFEVTIAPTSGGSIAIDPPAGPYPGWTSVRLVASPDPGFAFDAWSGDVPAGEGNPASLLVDSDKWVGASFVAAFDVTVAPPTGGRIALDPPVGPYPEGSSVSVTAIPDPGFFFAGWLEDVPAGQGNPASLQLDAPKRVGASFAPGFTVGVQPTSGGSVRLDPPAAGVYPVGTVVSATALPDAGYAFAGWSGDLAGQPNPASIVSDALVVARFAPPSPQLVELATGSSRESASVATATPLTAAEGDLYLAAISAKPHADVTGVSGLGLVWSPVRAQCAGRGQTGVAVWQARGQPSGDGSVAATLSGTTRSAVVAVSRYAGSAGVGGVVSGNSLGVAGACGGGQDGDAYALDLDTGTPSSVAYVAAAARQRDHLPGPDFVEQLQVYEGAPEGDKVGLSIAERPIAGPALFQVTGGFDAPVDWAVSIIEIRGPVVEP